MHGADAEKLASIQRMLPRTADESFQEARRAVLNCCIESQRDSEVARSAATVESSCHALSQSTADHSARTRSSARECTDNTTSLSATSSVTPNIHKILSKTTPLAIGARLIGLLPQDWIPQVVPLTVEAFFIAALEVDIHVYSPGTIATASIALALRAVSLDSTPTATYWLMLVKRSLHLDISSVRQCLLRLQRLARRSPIQSVSHEDIIRARASVFSEPSYVRHSSLAASHAAYIDEAVAIEIDMQKGEGVDIPSVGSAASVNSVLMHQRGSEPPVSIPSGGSLVFRTTPQSCTPSAIACRSCFTACAPCTGAAVSNQATALV